MTILQTVESLRMEQEKGVEHRFCCRVIMVTNIQQYIALLENLLKIPQAEMISASYLFDDEADILPRYENLTSSIYEGKWLILPGVSEYLRFFSSDEAESHRFDNLWGYTWPANNKGRIIIPLWGCLGEWHDKSLHFMDKINRADELYFDCTNSDDKEQHLDVKVLSSDFRKYKKELIDSHSRVIDGLRAWYEYWSNPTADMTEYMLITSRLNSIRETNGNVSVRIIKDTLSFIRVNMGDGNILTVESCPEEAQECLFNKALQGMTVDAAINSCLNIENFSPINVMSQWNVFNTGKKQLVKLWYHIHPDSSYLSYVMSKSKNVFEVEKTILYSIFDVNDTPPMWIDECQALIKSMQIKIDDEYLKKVEKITPYEDQIKFLSSATSKERKYLLQLAGKMMKEANGSVSCCKIFESTYPALASYMDGAIYDEELSRYMKLYKKYKLSNTLPDDETLYFANMQIESYDFRFAALDIALREVLPEQAIVLWIDALGAEWLPLLYDSLNHSDLGKIKRISVTRANLPTETKFNKQWKQMNVPYDKSLNRLDKLAHNGVIDDSNYYACIEEQIDFVTNKIKEKVHDLLKTYRRVIITGDHGTSRLAARFFHKREGISLKNGKPLSHGRYALMENELHQTKLTDVQIAAKDDKNNAYIVFKNYDHFKLGGNAAGTDDEQAICGEIHGGATPEEVLVPVVVFDSNEELPISVYWAENPVKISMKKVRCHLHFNQPILDLKVYAGINNALTNPQETTKEWLVEFDGIKAGKHQIKIVADGKFIPIEELIVKSAISNDDGDLP